MKITRRQLRWIIKEYGRRRGFGNEFESEHRRQSVRDSMKSPIGDNRYVHGPNQHMIIEFQPDPTSREGAGDLYVTHSNGEKEIVSMLNDRSGDVRATGQYLK